jgi:hypothetical protein
MWVGEGSESGDCEVKVDLPSDRFDLQFQLTQDDLLAVSKDRWTNHYKSWARQCALAGLGFGLIALVAIIKPRYVVAGLIAGSVSLFLGALYYLWKSRTAARTTMEQWARDNPDYIGETKVELDWRGVRHTAKNSETQLLWPVFRTVRCTLDHVFLEMSDGGGVLIPRRACTREGEFARLLFCVNEWREVDAGIESCPVCGYALKGQQTAGCTECGWNRAVAETPK